MNIADVLREFVAEKGLDSQALIDIASEGILAAYQKKYPEYPLRVTMDTKSHDFVVEMERIVVSKASKEETEISLQRARNINSKIKVGDSIWTPFDGKIGRVEILKARQVIAQRIRAIEAKQLYDTFKSKEGDIVVGTVQKYERNGVVIAIGEAHAFLPRTASIPGEQFAVGFTMKALLKEVKSEPTDDHQLVLDRVSPGFVKRLFELEIPEVFERIVEIKAIARAPGYRSKVVVASRDRNIEPVGACVGVKGSRINHIINELRGEKIDVIGWNEALEIRVKNALKPAVIDKIELSEDEKTAQVWLKEDQRAIAIGRGGSNVALVTQLTGVEIQFVTEETPKNDAIFNPSEDELNMQS